MITRTETTTELIARLRRHAADYGNGKTQNFLEVCADCGRAATVIEELLAQISMDEIRKEKAAASSDNTALPTRADVLRMAAEAVSGEREQTHGKPENNFAVIAALWAAYKGAEFSAVDVAVMMALLKIARIKSGHGSIDSFADLAGYAACGGELFAKEG